MRPSDDLSPTTKRSVDDDDNNDDDNDDSIRCDDSIR